MKDLVIDRTKWLRGESSVYSQLLRHDDNKMCCLGFLSLDCGANKEDIDGWACPNEIHRPILGFLFDVKEQCLSNLTKLAMEINDNKKLDEYHRESMLKLLFESWGYNLRFIN